MGERLLENPLPIRQMTYPSEGMGLNEPVPRGIVQPCQFCGSRQQTRPFLSATSAGRFTQRYTFTPCQSPASPSTRRASAG